MTQAHGDPSPTISDMQSDLRERAALVALLQQPKARWQEIALEVHDIGSAVKVLESRFSEPDTLFPSDETGAAETAILAAANDLAGWTVDAVAAHIVLDKSYPEQLRDIHQMPPILFSKGLLQDDRRAVAIVGARKASDLGIRMAQSVAEQLASRRITVVSGLAKGIDTAAHTAALKAGGRTVAVIGTGINRFYPAENRALQLEIAEKGLVISQFWPDAAPSRQSFPMRNAVMSGYAAATVVVEASERSGARIQARLALQHSRPVIMPHTLLQNEWATELRKQPSVYVVGSLREILEVIDQIIENAIRPLDGLPQASPLVST